MLWSLQSVSLPGRRSPRLADVSLEIEQGVTAIIGQSGAGKTSLLNLLVGFERPSSGTVRFHGQSSEGQLEIFWAPPQHGLWPHLTAREHLTTVLRGGADENALLADQMLAKFDLLEHAAAKPDSLSLGERSRLNVVRALCTGTQVLVMDEPLAHVDPGRCGKYWDAVRAACRQNGCSLVFSTHSPEIVLREASHVICLADGRVTYSGPVHELYERPASQDLAVMLGPCNWLTTDDIQQWCLQDSVAVSTGTNGTGGNGACFRPESISADLVTDSPLKVEEARFTGTSLELDLCDERSGTTKSFLCQSRPMKKLEPGQRVILRLMALMFVVFGFAGCYEDSAPVISVKRESNWLMPPDGAKVPAPRGMTVSPDNEYLVLDNAGRVLVFNETGDVVRQWWMPEYSVGKAEGICVLKDGRIAVADTHYHRVVFFDHEGQVTGMFGQHGSKPGDFVYPVKIAQDPEENLYVCEYGQNDRVQKFRPDGTFLLQFGGPGTEPGQFQRPSGIVWYDHLLYVVDAFNNRIQVFKETGELVAILKDSDKIAEVRYPYDITLDHNGDLYVVEYGGNRVSKFSRQGRLLGRYGKSGRGQVAGEMMTPWGVAMDRRGRLYVCDTGNRRIVELEL